MHSIILTELSYLPPVQFFTKFLKFEKVQLEAHEHYQKNSYRNRVHLAGPNGIQRLSIPLRKGKHQQQSIRDVEIAYDQNWQQQHWQTIQTCYGNAPFFEYFAPELDAFYQKKYPLLFEWNYDLLILLLELLQLPKRPELTDTYNHQPPEHIFDFRNSIFPKNHRQKEDKDFRASPYPQVFREKHGFLPNLSILDLLFCQGPEALRVLEQSIVR